MENTIIIMVIEVQMLHSGHYKARCEAYRKTNEITG